MKIAVLGASGRTGRLVVEQALAAGHAVRAVVRDPSRLGLKHERLEVVTADVQQLEETTRAVGGVDAVISAMGPGSTKDAVCSAATAAVLAARARRYVVVSGAGVDLPTDRKNLVGKAVSFMVRTLSPEVFHDKVRELELLQRSDVPWVLVRPPRLLDGPSRGPAKVSFENAPGNSIARADLAAFLLRAVADESLTRKAPFVAG